MKDLKRKSFKEIIVFLIFFFLASIILLINPAVRKLSMAYSLPSVVVGLMFFSFLIYAPFRFFVFAFGYVRKWGNEEKLKALEEVK